MKVLGFREPVWLVLGVGQRTEGERDPLVNNPMGLQGFRFGGLGFGV